MVLIPYNSVTIIYPEPLVDGATMAIAGFRGVVIFMLTTISCQDLSVSISYNQITNLFVLSTHG